MLTRNDINLLKAIFITKEEFRLELKNLRDEIRNEFNTSIDNYTRSLRTEFKAEMKKNTDTITKEIHGLVEMIGNYMHKTEILEEMVTSHETRLRKLE